MDDDLQRTNPPLPRGAPRRPPDDPGAGDGCGGANSLRRKAGIKGRRKAEAGSVAGLVGAVLIALARLYQLTLSRFLGGQCRFVPTCSQYFIDAVRARGPVIGSLKGLWRILRCNPFSKGGYDPAE